MNEMRELTDTELDAVCGGFFDFGNIVTQTNIATQVGVAVGGISGITGGNAGNAKNPLYTSLCSSNQNKEERVGIEKPALPALPGPTPSATGVGCRWPCRWPCRWHGRCGWRQGWP